MECFWCGTCNPDPHTPNNSPIQRPERKPDIDFREALKPSPELKPIKLDASKIKKIDKK